MRKLILLLLLSGLAASCARAEGFNLSWDDCGANGTETKTFACNTNSGSPFILIGSFVPPPGVTEFIGIEAMLEISTNAPALPDWWKHGSEECRGTSALTVSLDFVDGPYTCDDPWAGEGSSGWAMQVGSGGPNRARLTVGGTMPNAASLDPGREYYAFKIRIARSSTTGAGSCSGCDVPVCISLGSIKLIQPSTGSDVFVYAPLARASVAWQSLEANCPPIGVSLGSPAATVTTAGVPTEDILAYWSNPQTMSAIVKAITPGDLVELGVGPDGSDPTASTGSWSWAPATLGGIDNFIHAQSALTVTTPGEYDYCVRYSYYGSPWVYGDLDGSENGYSPSQAGALTVLPCTSTYTITASAGPHGSISPSGAVSVGCASNQSFTIAPDACYRVADVLVDGVSVGAVTSHTFTNVHANHTIAASFASSSYTITATAGPNGTISPSGAVTVNCGSSQVFTIAPNACYRVADVLVDGASVGAVTSHTFTDVHADHTIAASFAASPSFTITATAGPNGTISPSGAVTVNCGANQAFTITPDPCCPIQAVLVDGESVGAVPSYPFTNVTADHTIAASFMPPPAVLIDDVSIAEGNAGTTPFSFTVRRVGDPARRITAYFTTADGTALAGSDYVSASGAAVIPAGSSSATIVVEVQGDATFEAHEAFYVRLTEATNGAIADSIAVGTIRNDDEHPLLRDFYAADGMVGATALSPAGDVLYIGGDFLNVGPMTGGCAVIDSTTGQPVAPLPLVMFGVQVAVPDGQGGWFIGGDLTAVMGVPRQRLAHILPGGGLSEWSPSVSNGVVYALAVSGNRVYVGGSFTDVGGQIRNRVAALDAVTGAVTAWNPNANNTVRTLVAVGSTVYAGGDFTTIGGQPRNRIAALDATANTNNATAWDPNASSGVVAALLVKGSTVYAGGSFTTIGGQSRNRIAALDAAVNTNNATAWDPNADGVVNALVASGSTVYAGGAFHAIGGQTRNHIAALDATVSTNNATVWNPNANSEVCAIGLRNSTIYAGGYFNSIGGQARKGIAALDAASAAATPWDPKASGGVVRALAVGASTVCVGGDFVGLGWQARNKIAALDAATGVLTSWNPNANNFVRALAPVGSTVYVGGDFTSIGGQTRNRLAALDVATGAATSWNPNSDCCLYALAVNDSTVYAGGNFTTIGGQARKGIAAVDARVNTNNVTAWNPSPNNNSVWALAVRGSAVYAGGGFTTIGGQTRNRLAAIDAATGAATAWDPNVGGTVYALAASGTTVYAGGTFTSVGGQTRNNIAAIDATTGVVTAWNPNSSSIVSALSANGAVAGGGFTSIGGQVRSKLAVLDLGTGLAQDWNPPTMATNSSVMTFAVGNGTVYAGGDFWGMGDLPRSRFAALRVIPAAFLDVEPVAAAPERVMLAQSYPNPAQGGATIRFGLPRPGPVSLRVYDVSGRLVHVLLDGERPAGWHAVQWTRADARGGRLAAGIYFYELRAPGVRITRRLVALE